MWIGYLLFAILYSVTIIIIKYILNKIEQDRRNEINYFISELNNYKRKIKDLKKLVRELSGTQFCGNKDICLRKIENELNKMEEIWK